MVSIALLYYSVRAVSRGTRRLFQADIDRQPAVVLTYHAVHPESVNRFEQQMRHLRRCAQPIFADEIGNSNGRSVAVTFDDAFQSVFEHALPIMARYQIPATIFVPTGYLGEAAGWIAPAFGGKPAGRVASLNTLKAVDTSMIRLGSHTVTHPRLATLDRSGMHSELATSKLVLEDITGRRIGMLALPYGSCSAGVVAAASDAGYDRVFANVPAAQATGSFPLVIGRIDVSPNDWPIEFRLKAAGAYDWMILAVPAKRAIVERFWRRHAEPTVKATA